MICGGQDLLRQKTTEEKRSYSPWKIGPAVHIVKKVCRKSVVVLIISFLSIHIVYIYLSRRVGRFSAGCSFVLQWGVLHTVQRQEGPVSKSHPRCCWGFRVWFVCGVKGRLAWDNCCLWLHYDYTYIPWAHNSTFQDFSTVVHIEVKAHPVVKEMFNSNTLRYK